MSFLRKLFYCCQPDLSEDSHDIDLARGRRPLQKVPKIADKISFDEQLFDPKYIRDDEREHITFTKNGILAFIHKLNSYKYVQMSTKNNLTVFVRKEGSDICPYYYLGKALVTIPKSSFIAPITKEDFAKMIYSREERIKWDTALKTIQLLEPSNEIAYISRTISHRFLMMISERDFVDKRVEFFFNNAYYNFQSSIPENLFPSETGHERVKTYLNAFILTEDDSNLTITYYNQIDIKMNLSQNVLEKMVPIQLANWYAKATAALNNKLSIEKAKAEEKPVL